MLDPEDYDDVIVTVAHPWGDIEASLRTWIQLGPGPRPMTTISKARRRAGATGGDPAAIPQHRRRPQATVPRPAAGAMGSAC